MSNARKEHHYFEMFRRDFPLPPGVICYGDKPDVIVSGVRRVGIEITNFFLEPGHSASSEQRQRPRRNEVITKAQQLFQKQTGKNVEFTFGFDKAHPIKNPADVAKRLAALAKSLSNRKTGPIPRDLLIGIPEVSFGWLNAGQRGNVTWRLAQTFSVPVMSRQSLKRIITDKESKAKSYRPCDAYWLLVIVDFMDHAQDQEIVESLEGLESKFFEKVVVYKTVFGTFVEASPP